MTGRFIPDLDNPPRHFAAPAAPHGDPTAVRQTAAALRVLAAEVRSAQRQAATAYAGLGASWQGEGQRATAHPLAVVVADAERAASGLDGVAGVLDRYAGELDRAQHAHRFSWGKLLKVGAVVVVSAGVIVVTVGAAAPEVAAADSLLVGGEVTAMATASATATAAASSTAAELLSAARVLTGLRGLAAAVRPTLPWAVGFTGLDAVQQEVTTGRLEVGRLATEFGLNLVMPPAIGKAGEVVRGAAGLVDRPVAAAAASHLAAGGVSAAVEAAREKLEHGHISPADMAVSAGVGAGLSAAGSAVGRVGKAPPGAQSEAAAPAKAEALVGGRSQDAPARAGGGSSEPAPVGSGGSKEPPTSSTDVPAAAAAWVPPRQTADHALDNPLDLEAHEGAGLGHTIERHVGKTREYLQERLNTGKGKVKSTFNSLKSANDAVQRNLRENRAAVEAYAANSKAPLTLELRSAAKVGEGLILHRDGSTPDPVSVVTVLTQRDGYTYVLTSYLE